MCTSTSRNKRYPFLEYGFQSVIYLAQGGLQEIVILNISHELSQKICQHMMDR